VEIPREVMTKEQQKDMYESFFLNEGAINFVLEMDGGNLENLEVELKKAKKYCEIPAENANDLINQLKDSNFLGIARETPWEFSSISVLDYTGEVRKFACCHALFGFINAWGYKRPYRYFQIIYSSDFLVLWLGHALTGGPIFWLSTGNVIYRTLYFHKTLRLYPNICNEKDFVTDLDETSLDNVVKKYHKSLRCFDPNFKILEHEIGYETIELDKYFEKGFFYKGPKYNYNEYKKINYYAWVGPTDMEKKEITEMKNINADGGLFKIEIENMTYPHSGYAYLDLGKLEIVRTELK
jgi:hypothetical protein